MKTLGITGGIGSGKTTVCRMLEELGARVFYADEEGKRILREDPDVRQEIVDAFGEASYGPDGAPDRKYLAKMVFSDAGKLERINAIIHPRVFKRFEKAKAEFEGVPLLVMEAALIFETGGDKYLDAVAVVDATLDLRIRRVVERDDASPEQVTARLSHQLAPDELKRRADFVIENDGDLVALRGRVEEVFGKMSKE
ncbi:MAG: dephospho-CoA kinase [Rhodothermales bacterium]